MERFDSVIFITPHIGEYHNNNVYMKTLDKTELDYMGENLIFEYVSKHTSYTECMRDLKEKMEKIKKILEE